MPQATYIAFLCRHTFPFSPRPSHNAGTDIDGDGVRDWALCLDLLPPCKANHLLMAIASSVMQFKGIQQGTYLDPATMLPLANTTGMREAMRIYAALMEWASPSSFASCGGANNEFISGRYQANKSSIFNSV